MKLWGVLLSLLLLVSTWLGPSSRVMGQLEWLDPTMLVSTLTTTLTLIKFIKQIWAALADGSTDIADLLNIPGPLVTKTTTNTTT